jgi:Ser/Thr protein kinase RdoA (MazF antagonist)
MAEAALAAYGAEGTALRHICHAENTTFRVDGRIPGLPEADAPYMADRYLLRLHRPGYQTAVTIASELEWLAALRRDRGLAVPEPVPNLEGRLLTTVEVTGVPEPRVCSLLRWLDGRFNERRPRASHMEALGDLMAELHDHADGWKPPPSFERSQWDWDGLFMRPGPTKEDYRPVWDGLPDSVRDLYGEVSESLRHAMDALGDGPDVFGLVHADMHLGNVLFKNGTARAIDFDDCGRAHRVYDISVALQDYRRRDNWQALKDALLVSYTTRRPLSDPEIEHLETFMNGRCVSVMLWAASQAEHNPRFGENIDRWFEWSRGYLTEFHTSG